MNDDVMMRGEGGEKRDGVVVVDGEKTYYLAKTAYDESNICVVVWSLLFVV